MFSVLKREENCKIIKTNFFLFLFNFFFFAKVTNIFIHNCNINALLTTGQYATKPTLLITYNNIY